MKFLGQGFQRLEHEQDRQTDRHTDRCDRTHYHSCIHGDKIKLGSRTVPSEVSSVRSDWESICCSMGSSVYLPMLCSSSGTLVQCCIGEMSRSGSWSRWHLSSCPHHCVIHITSHLISSRLAALSERLTSRDPTTRKYCNTNKQEPLRFLTASLPKGLFNHPPIYTYDTIQR